MRRNDLDWLRVIVFGLLILYHVGMFFVPWGFHIKNDIIYPEIRWPMLFLNQWRLPILFVISGMGTYYALSRRTGGQFAKERFHRLFLPLVIGMLFIVPPQVYFERLDKGQFTGGFFEFWPSQAFMGVYPEGNFSWHHLWFLPYLLLFSLILIPAFLHLRKNQHAWLIRKMRGLVSQTYGLFWLIIPLYLWESLLEPFFPSTHALLGDWFNLVNYITLFFYGFLLISVKEIFWKTVLENRRKYLYLGLAGFSLMIGLRILYADSTLIHFIEAGFKVINLWAWILTLFGYAAAYLNQASKTLSYANEAVYPFYILHQTITISIGFYLMHLPWGFWPKFLVMVMGTFGISWLIYEFGIRRWNWMRPLFGMKEKASVKSVNSGNLVP
ncbi:MAG: glucan biosynthesis protein [Mongoliibacter sp.]|uniref:acyltransferase family protein n=1 Tax=Mongoliibacter sp. TaxID=2022438 RepID=UPI0012F0D79C|nr:acyltransferase family protein [Mongoliibacter sp.]TVP48974.1 MAG: glucan biosynthesis protein [Mongoliibacter sp.]